MTKKKWLLFILCFILCTGLTVAHFVLRHKTSEEKKEGAINPVSQYDPDDSEEVSFYYSTISEADEDIQDYEYRALVSNKGVLYDCSMPEEGIIYLEYYLDAYLNYYIDGDIRYHAYVDEKSYTDNTNYCSFNIRIGELDNLKIKVVYRIFEQRYKFESILNPEE